MKTVIKLLTLACFATILLSSCEDDNKQKPNPKAEEKLVSGQEVLSNTMDMVVMPTYKNLRQAATKMYEACLALQKAPTAETLEVARKEWRAARVHWEQSEAFLYGPTNDQGLDPALDEWPVDVEGMNKIIENSEPITPKVISAQNETRGFHLVEYLLWGVKSDKKATDFTPRELEYLAAAALDIKQNAEMLVTNWTEYINNFKSIPSKKYPSVLAAVEEIIVGMIDISDEVGNEKIENPLNGEGDSKDGKPHFDLEESRFSNNSKTDYINNIESIRNMYTCKYDGKQGKSISDLVVTNLKMKALDDKVKAQIDAAQKAIDEIKGTFTNGIVNDREGVKKAQQAVRTLNATIEEELKVAFHKDAGNTIK